MSSTAINIIVLLVIIAIVAVCWFLMRKRRSEHLRSRFGAEYDRMIDEHRNQRRAEAVLETREKRVQHLHIRALTEFEHDQFAKAWQVDQTRFVNDPKGAVTEADMLIAEVMKTRGYPVSDFEQRAADISVDHPQVVANYRAATEIVQRQQRDEATTEDLRRAMVYYGQLFDDLLETAKPAR